MEFLSSLGIYLRRIGKSWYGLVALASTIITFASVSGANIFLPDWLWVAAWGVSIFIAGFLTWREDIKEYLNSDIHLFVRRSNCHLAGGWLDTSHNTVKLNPVITIIFSLDFTLENHSKRGVHIRLSIDEVKADWSLVPDMDAVAEQMPNCVFSNGRRLENPVSLAATELRDSLHLQQVKIPFSFPHGENQIKHLGSLSELTIIVSAEAARHKKKSVDAKCDVTEIHDEIEDRLRTVAAHTQSLIPQAFNLAKEYWVERESKVQSIQRYT